MLNLNIPLFYTAHTSCGNGGVPELFPFTLYLDACTGLPRQEGSNELNDILKAVYGTGVMMTGSMDPHDLVGMSHAADCLAFTLRCVGTPAKMRILEIGCGRGHILAELSRQGGKCVGLEPGDQILAAGGDGIELVRDFFPSRYLAERKFDLITSFNVIEHIEGLEDFLSSVSECLFEDGNFVFCVPNCGPYLASGDISIFLHEHFNYFSSENIISMLAKYGLAAVTVEVSKNQALLLVHARKGRIQALEQIYSKFDVGRFTISMRSIQHSLMERMAAYDDSEIAIYCPNRSLNHMSQIGRKYVRIIDDTPALQGLYFPYFLRPVEDFGGLIKNPPCAIFIFSFTHAEYLRKRCQTHPALENTEVFAISDFYR